ncbi:MAG: NAD-dependent epimerase/dehydratase family protein [Roseiflexaceae bacterium]|nr:NAD-dependent epimerase/dehydratase family protein [Roseiflexaceae bacterium]
MNVLITGSSGQIGTNLALRLLDQGHTVFGVDKRINSWTSRIPTLLQDLSAPYRDFTGGIGSVPYPPVEIVIHLAANAKVHELVQLPHRAMENITLTFNVLEYCRHNRLPLIFSSSREVYGDIHRYITEEQQADFAYTESPYSASKIAGEALVYAYARCYGLRYLVFRFSNVYGRYDNDIERMERVIPLFIRSMARGEPVTVFGSEKTLDFTYVDDCVRGIVAGAERLLAGKVENQAINLAYGQGNTLVRMAEHIAAALGVPPQITVEPTKRVGEVTHYVADISKAQELLDYAPQVPLDEGIRRAVAWSQSWRGDGKA